MVEGVKLPPQNSASFAYQPGEAMLPFENPGFLDRGDIGNGQAYSRRQSFWISRAALWPEMPETPPPGCVVEPHRYKARMGVR
jgi:hypothetical protein